MKTVYPRPAEATGFCHDAIFFSIILGKMKQAKSRGKKGALGYDVYDLILIVLPVYSGTCTELRTGYMADKTIYFFGLVQMIDVEEEEEGEVVHIKHVCAQNVFPEDKIASLRDWTGRRKVSYCIRRAEQHPSPLKHGNTE